MMRNPGVSDVVCGNLATAGFVGGLLEAILMFIADEHPSRIASVTVLGLPRVRYIQLHRGRAAR